MVILTPGFVHVGETQTAHFERVGTVFCLNGTFTLLVNSERHIIASVSVVRILKEVFVQQLTL